MELRTSTKKQKCSNTLLLFNEPNGLLNKHELVWFDLTVYS